MKHKGEYVCGSWEGDIVAGAEDHKGREGVKVEDNQHVNMGTARSWGQGQLGSMRENKWSEREEKWVSVVLWKAMKEMVNCNTIEQKMLQKARKGEYYT